MSISSWRRTISACALLVAAALVAEAQPARRTGVLLLAHGGSPQWNSHVTELAASLGDTGPVEVAFGMASRAAIQGAVDRLTAQGVTSIVAVPLFVSSWSSVIASTEYLLGLRPVAPRDLAIFAKMNHGAHGAAPAADHTDHAVPPADPSSPVVSRVPITMGPALNRHHLIGDILIDRAKSVSREPGTEAVVLVAHGPVPDEDNRRWLEDMAVLAGYVGASAPYAAVHYMTVRDDAGPAMREAATKELRGTVQREAAAGRRVLIVPHLLSFGGIERGIQKRLEGLEYTMTSQAIMPDSRLSTWVREQVAQSVPPLR